MNLLNALGNILLVLAAVGVACALVIWIALLVQALVEVWQR